MDQIKLESFVKVLMKTVEELVCEVQLLRTKIDAQSVQIGKLSAQPTRNSSSSAVVDKPDPSSGLQRPMRAARKTATVAIAAMSDSTSKSRRNNSGTPPANSYTKGPVNSSKTSSPRSQAPAIISQARAVTLAVHAASDDDTDNERWETVSRRRSFKTRQHNAVIVGTAKNDNLQSVDRMKYIQAWQFKSDTTEPQVLNFLNHIVKAEYVVTKRSIKSIRHACFIIGMPESIYSRIVDPTVWPQGVCFANWFFRARSHQRPADEKERARNTPPRSL